MYIKMADLLLDETLYPRNKVHYLAIERYKKALAAGAVLPPIVVGKRGGRYVVIDGWHRYHAHEGRDTIAAVLSKLPESQWFMEAVKLNAAHGEPLSRQEKLAAAMRLRRDGVPDEQIQTIIGELVPLWQKAIEAQGHWIRPDDIRPIVLKQAVARGLATREVPPTIAEIESIAAAQDLVHSRSCAALVRELLSFLDNDFAPVDEKSIALLGHLHDTLGEWLRTHATEVSKA